MPRLVTVACLSMVTGAGGAAASPATSSAQSHECTPAPEAPRPTTQAWHRSNRCVPIHVNETSPLFADDAGLALVEESLAVWMAPSCTDLELRLVGLTDQRLGFDTRSDRNQNVILEDDLGLEVLALTYTFHDRETGEIYDADIVFNSGENAFDDVTSAAACRAEDRPVHDIRNTLIHELGHVLGFDHNDDRASTMFASAPACETSKRDLTSTDIQGICEVYPTQQPSQTCLPPDRYGSFDRFRNQCDGAGGDSGGCRSAGRSTGPWVLAGLALGVWAGFRRQR